MFVGRMPFVWLISAVGNSGVGQTTYYYTDAATAQYKPHFHANRVRFEGLCMDVRQHSKVELPKDPTIIDKDLKMPSTWKTSLALDMRLPGDVNFTLEGIYSRDYNPVV